MCDLDSTGPGYYPDSVGGEEDNCLPLSIKSTKLLGQRSDSKLLEGWAPLSKGRRM